MPRLATSLLRRARAVNHLLVPLLRTCRDLPSARNELRWIREHVDHFVEARHAHHRSRGHSNRVKQETREALTKKLCHDRGRGKPLQYVLGTEWFGDLEIACKPGVLIPRPETASMVMYLANLLKRQKAAIHGSLEHEYRVSQQIRVLDLCSGSGCMSLLLAHELLKSGVARAGVDTQGIDVSPKAIRLARENASIIRKSSRWDDQTSFCFSRADVLAPIEQDACDLYPYDDDKVDHYETHIDENQSSSSECMNDKQDQGDYCTDEEMRSATVIQKNVPSLQDAAVKHSRYPDRDIVLANPPYISPSSFRHRTTARSVRGFEPTLALVPPPTSADICARGLFHDKTKQHRADTFYPPIIDHSMSIGTKVLLMEVGGIDQAIRVARMLFKADTWTQVEIWKDGIDSGETESTDLEFPRDRFLVDRVKVTGLKGVETEARAVVCWWGDRAEEWLGRFSP